MGQVCGTGKKKVQGPGGIRKAYSSGEYDEIAPLKGEASSTKAQEPSQHPRRALLAVGGLLILVLVLASICSAVAVASARGGHGDSSEASDRAGSPVAVMKGVDLTRGFNGSCFKVDEGKEYVYATTGKMWTLNLDHIPSADLCCSMCQGVPKCRSWVYLEDALPDGCRARCVLNGAEPESKKDATGAISGLPPGRPTLPRAYGDAHGKELFCYSLMLPFGYELEMIAWQAKEKRSIFACDAHAVYSNKSIKIADGLETSVVNTSLQVKYGGDSGTALNSWVFIAIWGKVIEERWHEEYAWLAKLDPDAVFLPEKLRGILKQHSGVGYLTNCKYGLHGPLEVMSQSAFKVLAKDYESSFDGLSPKKCVDGLDFGLWGEDLFIDQCLDKIHGISKVLDERLLCEDHCSCPDWFWCSNGTDRVTFHPFKRVDMYAQCMANSLYKEQLS